MNLVLNLIVVSASVLGSGMAVPQALKLARTRTVDGVSPVWIGVSIAINGWWTAYALTASVWALIPVSTVSMTLYLGMAALYVSSTGRRSAGRTFGGLALGGLVLGMIPLPVLLLAGWETAGIAIGLCYGIQLAPAVVAAYRTHELDGVSSGTWIISFAEALLWLAYGLMIEDFALLAGGLTGSVMAGAILLRLSAVGSRPGFITVGSVTRVKVARD